MALKCQLGAWLQEGISTIITAIKRSHMIFRRLETYLIYRFASSIIIMGFFFLAILIFDFEIPTWVGAVPVCMPMQAAQELAQRHSSFEQVPIH